MEFNKRIIRKSDGSVVIKSTITLTPDEASAIERIPDDPNVGLDILRKKEQDLATTLDSFLTWLRIICHWVDIWNDRERPRTKERLMQAARERETRQKFISKKKRRRR